MPPKTLSREEAIEIIENYRSEMRGRIDSLEAETKENGKAITGLLLADEKSKGRMDLLEKGIKDILEILRRRDLSFSQIIGTIGGCLVILAFLGGLVWAVAKFVFTGTPPGP